MTTWAIVAGLAGFAAGLGVGHQVGYEHAVRICADLLERAGFSADHVRSLRLKLEREHRADARRRSRA